MIDAQGQFLALPLDIVLLDQIVVFVAEDEPFIALDLALAIEDAGGTVVGPAASIKEAFAVLADCPVDAAILDVNLTDGEISPIVAHLVERDVPLILQTGVGLPAALVERFPDLVVHIKPMGSARLIAELETLLAARAR